MAKNLGTTRYCFAVNWIAYNDDPTCMDREQIAGYTSTMLVADTFERDTSKVAQDILHTRQMAADREDGSHG